MLPFRTDNLNVVDIIVCFKKSPMSNPIFDLTQNIEYYNIDT